MEFEIVHINTSYGMVLSSVAKFIHGKAKNFSVFALLHRNKWNILSQLLPISMHGLISKFFFFFFSYPNSDSKFVAYIFIHSSKEAANSIKISVPTLLLPPLKRVPYTILCSSSTELTRRKHKTSIVEVFTAHWKSACWKVMYTLRSIS